MVEMSDSSKAPVDLFVKMHSALMVKNYHIALNYCNAILGYEQENAFMKKFCRMLTTKLEIMNDEETDYENTSSASSTSLMESDDGGM